MKYIGRNYWNKETMQKFCEDENNRYLILDTKIINKKYQNQLWAFVSCPNVKHEPYWVWWNNFRQNNRCKKCDYDNKNKKMWTKEDVIKIYKENGLRILDLNQWIHVDSPIDVDDEFGYKYSISISNLKHYGKSDYKFSPKNKFTLYNINNFCKINKPEYNLVSREYRTIKNYYYFKYSGEFKDNKTHNRYFMATLDYFVNGKCSHPDITTISSYEDSVELFLIKNKIIFEKQKRFKDCRYKKPLPFDFYIKNINLCIEVDGQMHTNSIDFFGGDASLKSIQKRDNIKNDYCLKNNIKLLRIPYWEFDNDNYKQILINNILSQK